MTKQIVIKLNEKKFKPLLETINNIGHGETSSYSDTIGKAVFFYYINITEKIPELSGKTRIEHIMEKVGMNHEQRIIGFLNKYYRWLKDTTS